MDKNKICEAMYALPNGVVVKRRKSLLPAFILLALGVGCLFLNGYYEGVLTTNLRSSLVFSGGVLLVMGVILGAIRLFGKGGEPYYKEGDEKLCYNELYFDRLSREEVLESVQAGAVKHLFEMKHLELPQIVVVIYRTIDCRFAVMQVFEYVELEYRPLTKLKVFQR